jgi:hypothetical protein
MIEAAAAKSAAMHKSPGNINRLSLVTMGSHVARQGLEQNRSFVLLRAPNTPRSDGQADAEWRRTLVEDGLGVRFTCTERRPLTGHACAHVGQHSLFAAMT